MSKPHINKIGEAYVPRGEKMRTFNETSSADEINRYLDEKYQYSLIQFENSLHGIQTDYKLVSQKKAINDLRRTIEYLILSKEELVKKINEFISKSKSWGWTKNSFSGLSELTGEQKVNFIKRTFRLKYYFEFVDRRIKRLNNVITILESIKFHAEDKRKRVQPHTVVMLIWTLAFQHGGASIKESFRETKALLAWFKKKRSEMLRESCGQLGHIGLDTIRRDFERYIKNANSKRKVYGEMAQSIYAEIFLGPD